MIAEPEHPAAARAHHAIPGAVAREIIGAERADVHESVDLHAFHLHEQAEVDDTGHQRVELLAELVAHVLALQPRQGIARRFVGPSLLERALLPERSHRALGPREGLGRPAAKNVADTAMDHEVRVAADRRSEVRVLRQGETEVTDVLRLIDRLRHGAHDDRLDQMRFLAAVDLLQHRAQVLRREVAIRRQLNAEAAQESPQRFEPFVFGLAVHTVQRRHAVFLEEARRFDVRGDHAFLDEPVRVVARRLDEGCDLAMRVEAHFQLRRVEVERTALCACP